MDESKVYETPRYAALQLALTIPLPPNAVWSGKDLIATAKLIESYLKGEDGGD